MSDILDKKNKSILNFLQSDASISVEQLAEKVALSRNACWRRIKTLEDAGLILRRVALLNPDKVGLPLLAVVQVRTNRHEAGWLEQFRAAIMDMPEVVAAWRMSGDLDYVLRVRVASVAGYDDFYQRLIERVPMSDVSASFVLEEMKDTTELPLFI
jgi:Lrp/AsnC family transcriptional regulator